jgi:hypothetical protein
VWTIAHIAKHVHGASFSAANEAAPVEETLAARQCRVPLGAIQPALAGANDTVASSTCPWVVRLRDWTMCSTLHTAL